MALTNAYATLDQFKDHMGVQDDADGTLMEAALNAASRAIDSHCRRRFYKDTTTSARVYDTDDMSLLKVDDFCSTSGLTVVYDSGDVGTYDLTWTSPNDYTVWPRNGVVGGLEGFPYYEIRATGNRWFWPSIFGRPRVQVTAQWGWAAVPDLVVDACLIKAARLYRRKDSPEGIAGGFEIGPIRISSREDPDVVMLLEPFVRPLVAG